MERTVANITQKETILVVGKATVLAPFALLTLPARPYHGSDSDLGTSVEVMLAADRAKQKVFELVRLEFRDLAEFPGIAVVVQVLSCAVD